jgi:membrane associated rhomboid family serine protease
VGLPVLRHAGSAEAVRKLWSLAHDKSGTPGAKCPVCDRRAVEVGLPIRTSAPPLRLDICALCQFVWFDPREFEEFPATANDKKEPLPQKAREAIAMQDMKRVAEQADRDAYNDPGPDEPWQWLPALLGMPVEENAPAIRCWPWVTWGLAALLVAVFALTFCNLQVVVAQWGLAPAELWRHDGATFITSFLLHGGWLHLIGNVYFLLVFGDNVEDDLGRWRYIGLVAAAALVGDACHIVGNLDSSIPSIGASGGVAGIIAYYALRFPHARLGMLCGYRFCYRWIHMPAYVALIFWCLLQVVFAVQQKMGAGDVAALAHLGGAGVGIAVWLVWRAKPAMT